MKTTAVTIRGLTALIMHNGQLADPLNAASLSLSKLTKKKDKTEADHLAIRKCEWYGGLYVDEKQRPCLPGEVLEALAVEGAKRLKLGKVAKGAIIIDGNFAIDYPGPKSPDALWADGGYVKLAGVRNKQNRVIRARPIFPKWECTFDVQWDPEMIKNEDELFDIFENAASVGVGDWRPKFGRFEVVS
jgi:hypothetical protein